MVMIFYLRFVCSKEIMSTYFSFNSIIEDFKRANGLALTTECSKWVLKAQEVKSAVESCGSIVEDNTTW